VAGGIIKENSVGVFVSGIVRDNTLITVIAIVVPCLAVVVIVVVIAVLIYKLNKNRYLN